MILYYDDTCRFCHKSISFLKKRNAKLTYIGLSKATLPKRLNGIDSLILKKEHVYYIYSDAAIRSICAIGGIYRVFSVFFIIPRFIRDWMYRKFALKRKSF